MDAKSTKMPKVAKVSCYDDASDGGYFCYIVELYNFNN